MASTNWAKNKIQDYQFGGVSFSPPSNYYIALSTTTVSSTGSNVSEPSGASYARVQVPNTKSYFTYSSGGCLVNSASIVFPVSTGSWGTVVDIVFMDASSSGSAWYYTSLPVPKIIQDATTISFSASAITISQS